MRTFWPSKAELSPSLAVEEQRHHVCWPELSPLGAVWAALHQGPNPHMALNASTPHSASSTHKPGAETTHTPSPLALQTCPWHLLGLLGAVPWPRARCELSTAAGPPWHITNPGHAGHTLARQMLSFLLLHPSSVGKRQRTAAEEKREWHSLGQSVKVTPEAQSKVATWEQLGREKHPGHLLTREGTGMVKPGWGDQRKRAGMKVERKE